MKPLSVTILILAALMVLLSGCSKETPSRDHIPLLKEVVFNLQESVRERNRAAIDSLLSPDILKHDQNSDSLLAFCFGPESSFAFERFGNCAISYTRNKAVAECFVMDSLSRSDRPVRLSFVYEHDLWLLSHFGEGDAVADSL